MDLDLFKEQTIIHSWILPVSLAVGGIVIGFIVEKILLGWFKRFSQKTTWEYDDLIANGLSFYTTFWISLIGFYAASFNIPINTDLLHHLHQLIIIIAILSVTFFSSKIAVGIVSQYSRSKTGDNSSTSIFVNITRVVVIVIGILIVLQSLGISITPIITALGVGGLAVALALQDTLSNFFAGLQILISKQIRPGDLVRLDTGEEGMINDINWRNTSIKTAVNNLIVIPNTKLSSAKVTNFNLPDRELVIPVVLNVSYESDLEKVEKVCIDEATKILTTHPNASKGFDPFVRFLSFEESAIQLKVFIRTSEATDQQLLKHDFLKMIHKRFKQEGIEIPYPIRTLLMKK